MQKAEIRNVPKVNKIYGERHSLTAGFLSVEGSAVARSFLGMLVVTRALDGLTVLFPAIFDILLAPHIQQRFIF